MTKATIRLIAGSTKARKTIGESLERCGYRVTMDASRGAEQPDAVLAQFSPNAKNKIEAVSGTMPIIILLDRPPDGESVQFLASGKYEFIINPVDTPENILRIDTAISRWKQMSATNGRLDRVNDLAESIHEGIMIVEGESIRYVNNGLSQITGYTIEELTAMNPWDLVVPEERNRVRSEFPSSVARGRTRRELQYWVERKNGERRFVHNYFSPLGSGGPASGYVIITSDQTEPRLAWEKLRESEERFRNLAESTTMAILLYQDDKWIFANTSAERITEYTADELLKMNFWDFVHPDHQALGKERGQKRQAGRHAEANYELKIITKTGNEKWVLVSGSSTMFGGKTAGLISVSDITGMKKIEEELTRSNLELLNKNREIHAAMEELEAANEEFEALNEELIKSHEDLETSERNYREMIENVPVGIYQSSPDGRLLTANPEMARILGYENPESVMAIEDIARDIYVDPEIRDTFVRTIESQEEVKDFEARFRKKNGGIIWVSINARLRRGKDGIILYYDGYIRDITSARQALEEKGRLEKQLLQSQKMEAVGRLAGGIAHDFNNLLTAIIGNAEFTLMMPEGNKLVVENTKDILATASRAADLTRQLLAFSRKQIIKPVAVNLSVILDDMERMLGRIIGEDITITLVKEPDLYPIEADPSQIEQLIVNLVVNARDAMPRGGALSIMTANFTAGASIATEKPGFEPGRYAMLRITDTGIGIDKEIIDHIFEPFFTTKGEMGTGLGLATVYGIVKQNKGYVEVESATGKGSSFAVYFPVSNRVYKEIPPVKIPAAVLRSGNNEAILIIEDEESVRKLASKALTHDGFMVYEASNGAEAQTICSRHGSAIRLILSDVVLPGASGPDIMPQLQNMVPGVKVLYMSGYAQDAIVSHSVLRNGINFIAKPFYPSELIKKIKDVLFN